MFAAELVSTAGQDELPAAMTLSSRQTFGNCLASKAEVSTCLLKAAGRAFLADTGVMEEGGRDMQSHENSHRVCSAKMLGVLPNISKYSREWYVERGKIKGAAVFLKDFLKNSREQPNLC